MVCEGCISRLTIGDIRTRVGIIKPPQHPLLVCETIKKLSPSLATLHNPLDFEPISAWLLTRSYTVSSFAIPLYSQL
jgi:hypothetical protein